MEIAGITFTSRLILGTARYPNRDILKLAIAASGAQIVTMSMRRYHPVHSHMSTLIRLLQSEGIAILPNTASCRTAKEAVLTAQLAREALNTNWIKLEVIGGDDTLLPDCVELLKAAEALINEDFTVLPYCNDDLITCLKLADMGCAAIMPLGSPIGSGMGILNPYNLALIRARINIPLILDAGIGTASDVAKAMELGCDGVMVNTAIAQAHDPIQMAAAMKYAGIAGREAFLAGRIAQKDHAEASSPVTGLVGQ